MTMMEKMMEFMMGRMSQHDKEEMMDKMMSEFFGGMTAEDKQKMMASMMPRMMEGMNMMEMMPKMMMGMMGGGEGKGCMPGTAPEAGAGAQSSMMPAMMMQMMPHCLGMMLAQTSQEQRGDVVLKMLDTLLEKGCSSMSDEDKRALARRITEKTTSTLGGTTQA